MEVCINKPWNNRFARVIDPFTQLSEFGLCANRLNSPIDNMQSRVFEYLTITSEECSTVNVMCGSV
jgi:hypothetical protein